MFHQDDLIDDVHSFVAAAEVLKERGAYKIYVLATHGLLSSDAPSLIEESPIDEVVVTNTIPHELQKMQCSKIKTVDISVLLSEAIRRIHNKESMSYLFKNVTLEDWETNISSIILSINYLKYYVLLSALCVRVELPFLYKFLINRSNYFVI